jgi:hypothetical protein
VTLIGQSLELRRAPLSDAIAARDRAPLLARAQRQLAAGVHALDLNAGRGDAGSADALRWTAQMLRDAGVDAPLLLDCGDPAVLVEVLHAGLAGPLVVNALPLEVDGDITAHALLTACTRSGAGAVFAPRAADAAGTVAALLASYARALAFMRTHDLAANCYFDCLAYPPVHDRPRMLRSLAWLRALRTYASTAVGPVPLVAVGNVGFGVAPALRPALRRAYAACAVGAGAHALMLPVEDARLRDAVAIASGARRAVDDVQRWWDALARAARDGAPLPAPPAGDVLREVYALLSVTD